MISIIPRKVLRAFVTLVLASIVAFLLVVLLPGDPAQVVAGDTATPETVERVREQLGLNDPLITQYGSFLGSALQGDLGDSVQVAPGTPVTTLISKALPATASLVLVTMFWSLVIAVPLGFLAARRAGSFIDRSITAIKTVSAAVPSYVLCLAFIVFFAVNRQIFPFPGYAKFSEGFWPWLEHLILPSLALGLVAAAELARVTRASFVEVLNRDYTRLTTAKGMTRRNIIWKHSFRNASTPIITMVGLQASRLIGGTLIVEQIFVLPGIGTLAVGAVNGRDIVVVQGVVLFTTLVVVIINLLVDVLDMYTNPVSRRGAT